VREIARVTIILKNASKNADQIVPVSVLFEIVELLELTSATVAKRKIGKMKGESASDDDVEFLHVDYEINR
jgi:hypothetical protein